MPLDAILQGGWSSGREGSGGMLTCISDAVKFMPRGIGDRYAASLVLCATVATGTFRAP